MARIPYANIEETPEKIQEFFSRLTANTNRVMNLHKMMAHSPAAVREFIRIGNRLLYRAELSDRLRELTIIRVSELCGSRYEWVQHVPIALGAGISKEQLEDLSNWQNSDLFSEEDKAILAFTEEVVNDSQASDATFEAAARFLDHTSLVELTLSIGYWSLVAKFLRTFQIEIEDGLLESTGDLLPDHGPVG
ncbi:MAG: carboxymuconolactone decarboxylase family protein [Deltaproteobacteria bacterium]|nr:carboxymuconolactone decarboxylase family protein [Deltaproteobacteria bacterium]